MALDGAGVTLRRFVRADGWERWLEVPDPPPRHHVLHVIPPPAPYFSDAYVAESDPNVPTIVFNREPWRAEGCVFEEPVFVEDGARARADLFGADRPSLQRERELREHHENLVERLRTILAETYDGPNVLGAALAASHALERIHDVMRDHDPEGAAERHAGRRVIKRG